MLASMHDNEQNGVRSGVLARSMKNTKARPEASLCSRPGKEERTQPGLSPVNGEAGCSQLLLLPLPFLVSSSTLLLIKQPSKSNEISVRLTQSIANLLFHLLVWSSVGLADLKTNGLTHSPKEGYWCSSFSRWSNNGQEHATRRT